MNIKRDKIATVVVLTFILLFLQSINMMTIAQEKGQSDFRIVREFEKEYKSLHDSVTEINAAVKADSLIASIKELEKKFSKHRDLLNKVLYPESFEGELTQLKRRAVNIQQQLVLIEKQQENLKQLHEELDNFSQQLEAQKHKTDSLHIAIQKSLKSENQLSGMVRKYRTSLERRDQLILSIVDSVMMDYRDVDTSSIRDLENAQKKARFEANGNALNMIRDIINENIEFLKSDPELLTEEYLRMNSVQHQFNEMWQKVGKKMVTVYAGEKHKAAKQKVDTLISQWDMMIDTKTWNSLNMAIKEKGIQLTEFNDNSSFYRSLDSYLDSTFEISKKDRTEKIYAEYQKFYEFWNSDLQKHWSPYLDRGNILTRDQIALLNQKLQQWSSIAKPESNVLAYLLGASIFAMVLLGFMWAKEKKSTA